MSEKSMNSVKVRAAREDDIPAMVRFNCALAHESEGKELDRSTVLAGVTRGMEGLHCRYFVAEADGQVVGMIMLTFEPTDWRDGMTYWIQNVFVEPDWRGRGVFRALYKHVEKVATDDPAGRCLRLYVERDNTTAIAAYEKFGMVRENYVVYEKPIER